jgi:predicted amidohydrolase YtcJ
MMKNLLFYILIILFAMNACTTGEKADLILHNAVIYTVDDVFSVAEAFAVKDGKFLAVGTSEEILARFKSDHTIDAQEKFIYPGFYDAHCHFYGFGSNLLKRADLKGTKSIDEVIERLVVHHELNGAAWIEGRGWDQNDWEVKEYPSKEMLDKVLPDNPVYLIRVDGHAALVNSEALRQANVTAQTIIEGGEIIVRDGEPTGILIDKAMTLVSDLIPEPDEDFYRKALLMAQEHCFAAGLTSVADAGLSKDLVELIDTMHREGSLQMRVYAMLDPSEENIERFVKKGTYHTDRLTVRSIKLYADGALGSRGARMIDFYSDDPGNRGLFMYGEDYYMHFCQIAYDHGYQVNTHAIGDEANRLMLYVYSRFLEEGNDRRWRIEHAQVVHPDDFRLFGEYSIIPSVQPTHATSDMYWAEDRIGDQRISGAYAFKDLLLQNGWIPLGTDFPIEGINPLHTFYAAVARKDLQGCPEDGFQPENALTREEALRGMTIWAARAGFEEEVKGSIEPGKWADFVVLGEDLLQVDIRQIPSVHILSTFVNGEVVFEDQQESYP